MVGVAVLKTAFKVAWAVIKNLIIDPLMWAWGKLKKYWPDIKAAFLVGVALVKNAFKRVWDKIKTYLIDPVREGYESLKKFWTKIKAGFTDLWNKVKGGATSFKNAIGDIWDKIKSKFDKPVAFVVNTVINDGILAALRKVVGFLGLNVNIPSVSYAPEKKARGGYAGNKRGGSYVPGYGNRDSVQALLTPGEFVLRKDAVKAIGHQNLMRLNDPRSMKKRAQKKQGLHMGGIVQSFGLGDLVRSASKFLRMGAANGIKAGFDVALRALGSSSLPFPGGLKEISHGLLSRVAGSAVNWVRGQEALHPRAATAKPTPPNSGKGVNIFASGGLNSELAPALLTPGEWVFSKNQVSSIGLSNLRAINRSGYSGLSAFYDRFAAGGLAKKRKKRLTPEDYMLALAQSSGLPPYLVGPGEAEPQGFANGGKVKKKKQGAPAAVVAVVAPLAPGRTSASPRCLGIW